MLNKLNQTERKQYSSKFASKITEDFFNGKEFATGEDILNLTPVQQINHTIIQKLYGQWKNDAMQFRSPYFDFDNEEVKEALESFMNTVSRHIFVRQPALFDLLKEATDNTLVQILDPATYYGNQLRALPDLVVTADSIKEMGRFNKIHRKIVAGLSEKLSASGADFVYVNQASRWLDELLNDPDIPDAADTYIIALSQIVPLEPENLQLQEPAPIPVKEEKSFFDYVQKTEDNAPAERIISGVHVTKTVLPVPDNHQAGSREDLSLNSTFKSNQSGDNNPYNHIKIESIAGSIPLAQRFVYISQLFKGNSDEFDQSIKMLDRCSSFTEAHEFIHKSLAQRYDWDTKSERVKELLATVRRKFN